MEDVFYFSRRAQEAREAAHRAETADVRDIHLRFAEAYDAKVRELTAKVRGPKLQVLDGA